eukprot:scaffold34907_cov69-Phaeocystis_antarctica.AAC.2
MGDIPELSPQRVQLTQGRVAIINLHVEAGDPPAGDVAVFVISGSCPALQQRLGAPLAREVAHVAVGKCQAHQPLGARCALVVVHPRCFRILSEEGRALERLPAAQQRAAFEPPLEVATLRHVAHPRAGHRHRVELRVFVGLRWLEIPHVSPHLGLADRAAAQHALAERHQRACVRWDLLDCLAAERRDGDAERGAVARRGDYVGGDEQL